MCGKVSLSLHHTVWEPPVLGAAGLGRWPVCPGRYRMIRVVTAFEELVPRVKCKNNLLKNVAYAPSQTSHFQHWLIEVIKN